MLQRTTNQQLRIRLVLLIVWSLTLGLSGLSSPRWATAAISKISPNASCNTGTDPIQDRSANISSEADGVAAINAAHAAEGLPALSLPGNFYSLSPSDRILVLFNQERQVRGRSTFGQNDPVLGQVALNHSHVLIDFKLFAHDDAVDGTFGNRVGSAPGVAGHTNGYGEIIAGAPFSTYMVWLWMYDDSSSSWGHRQNILNSCYTHVGIGYVSGGAYGAIATGDFLTSNGSYQANTPDTTPPSLTFGGITFNSNASSVLSVSATTTDGESGMRHVAFFLDAKGNFSGTDVPTFTQSGNTYSKSFSGVAAGNHTVTAVAVDKNNNYVRKDIQINDGPPLPSSPTNLTATTISASQINLSWSALNGNQTSFELQRSTDRNNWTAIAINSATATSYQNTGLLPGTTYYYQLRAINSTGSSAFSNQASATTLDVPPAAPTNLTATTDPAYGFSTINLSWTRQAAQPGGYNESGFEVQRSNNGGGSWTTVVTTGAGVTTFTDNSLTASTTYTYRVRAVNSAGASAYTASATVSTNALPPTDFTVDDPQDDGTGAASVGHTISLSYALKNTTPGHAISFNVTGNIIHATAALPSATRSGIFINPAGDCTNPLVLQYTGSLPNQTGLTLTQGMFVKALTVKGFSGWQIKGTSTPSGGSHLVCVRASKTP